jgi:hypothetical protein
MKVERGAVIEEVLELKLRLKRRWKFRVAWTLYLMLTLQRFYT